MKTDTKKLALNEFVKTLKKKYKNRIKKIILFGSYARGDYDEESDIDILVIGDVPQREISYLSAEILLKYGEVISTIVETPEEFEKFKDSFFHKSILKEGVEIG
ncbi:nucleotidyltransferase domain-containing protein [Methanotorris formicicus]|uniref:protein adenylyltransferase n=1 Tax=Methanotorris formicicus Mc-S-70 TaxID=647171 RepID=H1KZ52_9EURY|nr:nucleotidyltransferase domain-containing protein [Methanotorris formicicus]EHP86477.1 DNA polymerase beta domain protein region [Methanotorris formicicus Mc-S-70]